MKKLLYVMSIMVAFAGQAASAQNSQPTNVVLFDVEARKAQLRTEEYAQVRKHCLAKDIGQPPEQMPTPVRGLKTTEGYGSDGSMHGFAWYMMIHGGRALAGVAESRQKIEKALIYWAEANALDETVEERDAYYALKRSLIPIIVNYLIVKPDMAVNDQRLVERWIDPLVRKTDHYFESDIDHNNHRYAADVVLTLWGDAIGDKVLYQKGKERFKVVLEQMEDSGALPLETRRGSRALWYIRQSIANMLFIAEVYHQNNDDSLYDMALGNRTLGLLTNHFISGIKNPMIPLEDAAENLIPGPSEDFFNQDHGMLVRRGSTRHYMAFAHLYNLRYQDALSGKRLKALTREYNLEKTYPLIDDFMGGNATCFWGTP